MRKITKLMLALAFCVVSVGSANAQDYEEVNASVDMFHTWSGVGADAISTGSFNATLDLNKLLTNGDVVWGDANVNSTVYADLSEYSKIVITGTPDEGRESVELRVMFNREANNGNLGEIKPLITPENGTVEVDLTSYSYFHLNAIKIQWGNSGTISSVKLLKPADPLKEPRSQLKAVIDNAKLQSSVGKTVASFSALTTEITKAEKAYAAAGATEESLGAAKTALQAAIEGLTLEDGYSYLTAEMYNASCTPELFKTSDIPYGDINVNWMKYADLTTYDKLIVVVVGNTKPRFCMNRLEDGGQCASTMEASKMLDINPNAEGIMWATERYQTIDGQTYIIDLDKIAKDYGYAYLHCIKKQGYGTGVFVTDMLLYSEPKTLTSKAALEGYKTFYNATFNYEVDANTTIYKATAPNNGFVTLTAVDGNIVPKNTPVILKTSNTTDYTITMNKTTDAGSADFTGNALQVATAETTGVVCILAYTTADGLGFFPYSGTLNEGDVYLVAPTEAKFRIVVDGENDDATGITKVSSEVLNDVLYNVAGQRVTSDYKGIVIKMGKKFLNK